VAAGQSRLGPDFKGPGFGLFYSDGEFPRVSWWVDLHQGGKNLRRGIFSPPTIFARPLPIRGPHADRHSVPGRGPGCAPVLFGAHEWGAVFSPEGGGGTGGRVGGGNGGGGPQGLLGGQGRGVHGVFGVFGSLKDKVFSFSNFSGAVVGYIRGWGSGGGGRGGRTGWGGARQRDGGWRPEEALWVGPHQDPKNTTKTAGALPPPAVPREAQRGGGRGPGGRTDPRGLGGAGTRRAGRRWVGERGARWSSCAGRECGAQGGFQGKGAGGRGLSQHAPRHASTVEPQSNEPIRLRAGFFSGRPVATGFGAAGGGGGRGARRQGGGKPGTQGLPRGFSRGAPGAFSRGEKGFPGGAGGGTKNTTCNRKSLVGAKQTGGGKCE